MRGSQSFDTRMAELGVGQDDIQKDFGGKAQKFADDYTFKVKEDIAKTGVATRGPDSILIPAGMALI